VRWVGASGYNDKHITRPSIIRSNARQRGVYQMQYRQLGSAGARVSAIGLGGNNFGRRCDAAQTAVVVHHALDVGINHIDTADIYGGNGLSEEYVGKAIADCRSRVFLATKVAGKMGEGPNDRSTSRGHILDGLHASLRRLGTDYVDLYYIHFDDPTVPLDETLRALDDVVRQGKVRYVAFSNFSAWRACAALWVADRRGYAPFVVSQSPYNVLNRSIEADLVPFCRAYGLGIVPYSPLAGGILTGKYRLGQPVPPGVRGSDNPGFQKQLTPETLGKVERLSTFAADHGHTVGELAIAWLLAQSEVCSVIAGATKPEQIDENVAAGDWPLTPADVAAIDELVR
jgi:aryl-alcohol dehydrogenase-like predicted oxidoreductase